MPPIETKEDVDVRPGPSIPIWLALVPIVLLIALLWINVRFYHSDASYGPNQIVLVLAAATAALIGRFYGVSFATTNRGMIRSIGSAVNAMLILLLIGGLTGAWLLSGVVPAMIYYGLQVLSPGTFLVAAVIISAVVSLATGSSWTTVATVGVALLGIGKALGLSEPMIAGAIISGAYFGDKISPLSDTTNLASAVAGVELFTHIRYMLWTTTPSLLITLGIFWFLGSKPEAEDIGSQAASLSALIDENFNISPWLFAIPGLVIAMVVMRTNAIVALFVAMLAGVVIAVAFQPGVIKNVADVIVSEEVDKDPDKRLLSADDSYAKRAYVVGCNAITVNMSVPVNNDAAQELFESRGMKGMLNTIWLILAAMCFGGAMEATGLLACITAPLIRLAKSTGSLIATTAGTCLFVNVSASDQYLAIVVPGRMFKKAFSDRKLAPQNLSRTLEDSGTVTSVLIPWNTCGAAQQGALKVDVLAFAPYCFFCWISPLMTILYGVLGLAIAKSTPSSDESPEQS
ncbi:MAG TPA: Na+/H+ antiporter NhaC family protein [Pirellulaceae bacterium]|nr:Na+/H+ antiporter NhaC family protein [Pirellulaceae bacterium]